MNPQEGEIKPGEVEAHPGLTAQNSLSREIKVPQSIQIGGTVYKIIIEPSLIDLHLAGQLDECAGEIRVSPNQSDHDKLCTIIHESLHAISRKYNTPLTEEQIEGLDDGLLQFILQLL